MSYLIAWCGFVGAWLLVAGPTYQAVIDLDDEDIERDEFAHAVANVPSQPRISRWWLLVPPIAYVLHMRRRRQRREALVRVLSSAQMQQLLHFRDSASAWMYVGSGAFLLAVPATWSLCGEYQWPNWMFWVIFAFMVTVCIATTTGRIRRRQRVRGAA